MRTERIAQRRSIKKGMKLLIEALREQNTQLREANKLLLASLETLQSRGMSDLKA